MLNRCRMKTFFAVVTERSTAVTSVKVALFVGSILLSPDQLWRPHLPARRYAPRRLDQARNHVLCPVLRGYVRCCQVRYEAYLRQVKQRNHAVTLPIGCRERPMGFRHSAQSGLVDKNVEVEDSSTIIVKQKYRRLP